MTLPISSNSAIQSQPGTLPAAPATQTATKVDRYARMIFTIGDRFFEVTLEGVSATREDWTQLRALLSHSLTYHYEKFHIPKTMSIGITQTQDSQEQLLIGDETRKAEPLRTQYRDYLAHSLKVLKAHRQIDEAVPHRTLMLTEPTSPQPTPQQPQTPPPAQQPPQAPRDSGSSSDPGADAGAPTTPRRAPSSEDKFFSLPDNSSDSDSHPYAPSFAVATPAQAAAPWAHQLAERRKAERLLRPRHSRPPLRAVTSLSGIGHSPAPHPARAPIYPAAKPYSPRNALESGLRIEVLSEAEAAAEAQREKEAFIKDVAEYRANSVLENVVNHNLGMQSLNPLDPEALVEAGARDLAAASDSEGFVSFPENI